MLSGSLWVLTLRRWQVDTQSCPWAPNHKSGSTAGGRPWPRALLWAKCGSERAAPLGGRAGLAHGSWVIAAQTPAAGCSGQNHCSVGRLAASRDPGVRGHEGSPEDRRRAGVPIEESLEDLGGSVPKKRNSILGRGGGQGGLANSRLSCELGKPRRWASGVCCVQQARGWAAGLQWFPTRPGRPHRLTWGPRVAPGPERVAGWAVVSCCGDCTLCLF